MFGILWDSSFFVNMLVFGFSLMIGLLLLFNLLVIFLVSLVLDGVIVLICFGFCNYLVVKWVILVMIYFFVVLVWCFW